MSKRFFIYCLIAVFMLLAFSSCATKKLSPMELGLKSFEAQEYEAAKTQFEVVLAAEESNHQAVYHLGRIARQSGDEDEAVKQFEKAVSLDETNSQYHFMLGVGYAQKVQKGAFQLAPRLKEAFEKAVELDGNNLEARMGLAQFYMNAPPFAGGSETKAKEQIDAIQKIDPVKGHLFTAQVQAAKKKYDEAEASFEAAAELEPKNPDIYFQLGMMHQAAKNYPAAFEGLEKALEIDPGYMNGLYQIARTAIFSGENLERGVECINTYLKNEPAPGQPSLAHAHWRLGMVYEKMGNTEMAKKEYKAALELNPDIKEAREALEKL